MVSPVADGCPFIVARCADGSVSLQIVGWMMPTAFIFDVVVVVDVVVSNYKQIA